ncbi:hypothetical protein SDC9_164199 [bioreactor metagenome]|uniref:Uncharacterized protein n=1 Tax=bioreactor metagenome TaxID=1076179 RepID=A0A645FT78_9ZZZZ
MVQKAERQPVELGRFHPAFLDVKLDKRDALDKLPRDGGGQHRPLFRLFLAHHEPHFRRQIAPAGAAQPLQERGHHERRVDLEGPFQSADVDAELQRGGGDGGLALLFVFHNRLRGFPI